MYDLPSMEVAHGLGNLLGKVDALLQMEGLGPGVDALVEGRTTTKAVGTLQFQDYTPIHCWTITSVINFETILPLCQTQKLLGQFKSLLGL